MPLTNAEKLRRVRAKKAATLARYEAALREIADLDGWSLPSATYLAHQALNPDAKDEERG